MKWFKRIAIVLFLIIISGAVGLFIFIKTFDLNKYLPDITKAASASMGKELTIGQANLGLTFQGITLECANVQIKDLLEIKRVTAGVEFGALLTQHKLNLKDIRIESINVNMADPKMPLNIRIPLMRASVTDFSLTEPFLIKVDFNLASSVENVHLVAKLQLDSTHAKVSVSEGAITADLSQLDMGQIRQISPVLAKAALPVTVAGNISAKLSLLSAGAKGLEALQGNLSLVNAGASLNELPTPITKAAAEANFNMTVFNVSEFHLFIGEGIIKGQAQILNYLQIPTIVSKVNVDGLKIEDLIDQSKAPVVIKGKITANGSFNAQTFDPDRMIKTLKGQGEFSVTEGVIEKLNIAKAVLGQTLGILPGLAESLDALIAGTISRQLGENATALDKVNGRFSVADGVLHLEDGKASAKAFELNATGTVGFVELDALLPMSILLAKDLSDEIAGKVEQLGYLRDESGRIKIGGQLEGKVPNLKFKPNVDVKQTTRNAIIEEGGKQLEKVIEKNPQVGKIFDSVFGGGDSAAQDANGVATENSSDKAKKAIGNLLNSILK